MIRTHRLPDGASNKLWRMACGSAVLALFPILVCAQQPPAVEPADPPAPEPLALPEALPLPDPIAAAVRAARLPSAALSFVVLPLQPGGRGFSFNENVPMNPASTMKLLTTYAALSLLGPAYQWRTEALTAGQLDGDTLKGSLILKGSGDPSLVVENFWLLVQQIRAAGIRHIQGDLLLDKSAFEAGSFEVGSLDGNDLRPYNAAPDALLVNFKSVSFIFTPDADNRVVRVSALPALAGLPVAPVVRAVDGPCGDWHARLQADFSQPHAPKFKGAFPLSCGERSWSISLLSHSEFVGAAFRGLWEASGGTWTGRTRDARTPPTARRIAVHESPTLAEIVRDINKFSNNVMTRQLFLTIGAEASHLPGSPERADKAIREWLGRQGLAIPELQMENGSGLSRTERISAAGLARLLAHAWTAPTMPELMSSLPLAGIDGTMKHRNGAAGSAHVKTGTLAEVRAIAGYVLAASGRRYVVVGLANHPNAAAAQPIHDALLQWVFEKG